MDLPRTRQTVHPPILISNDYRTAPTYLRTILTVHEIAFGDDREKRWRSDVVPLNNTVAFSNNRYCFISNGASKLVNGFTTSILGNSLSFTYTRSKRVTASFVLRESFVQHPAKVYDSLFAICYHILSTRSLKLSLNRVYPTYFREQLVFPLSETPSPTNCYLSQAKPCSSKHSPP